MSIVVIDETGKCQIKLAMYSYREEKIRPIYCKLTRGRFEDMTI
jgi:hypothetical protein